MGVDYSTLILLPNYDLWARPVTIYPLSSQGSAAPSYGARGIFDSDPFPVVAEDGSIIDDDKTILDIREAEFDVALPRQGDLVDIPADGGETRAEGMFQIISAKTNGGGETTLTLKQWVTAAP